MLVGITGLAGSGKSTAAQYFVDKHGFKRMSFADAVRDRVSRMLVDSCFFGTLCQHKYYDHAGILDLLRDPEFKKPYRGLMQWMGEFERLHDPMHWVRILQNRIHSPAGRGERIVVDDVRHANEAEMIRQEGGVIVRLTRRGAGLEGEQAQHPSEASVNGLRTDYEVLNNGGLHDLHTFVDWLMACHDAMHPLEVTSRP